MLDRAKSIAFAQTAGWHLLKWLGWVVLAYVGFYVFGVLYVAMMILTNGDIITSVN